MKRILILLACLTLVACSQDGQQTPEQKIRETLAAVEVAAEERSLSDVMIHVSKRYRDHEGRSADEVKRTAQLYLLANQKIHIFTRIASIDIQDKLAAVELSAALASSEAALADEQQRLRADTIKFSLALALEGDDWKITSASWQRGW